VWERKQLGKLLPGLYMFDVCRVEVVRCNDAEQVFCLAAKERSCTKPRPSERFTGSFIVLSIVTQMS
jgi:hypothetical protein